MIKTSVQHLLMISFDAVSDKDMDLLLSLPHFGSLCRRGTLVREVESVFISNTYPAHASIITGVYPGKHGIIENLLPEQGNPNPAWRNDSRLYRVPTLYDKAEQAGLTVSSVLYPVTCNAGIHWNFPEIAGVMSPLRRLTEMLRRGSLAFVLQALLRNRIQQQDKRFKGIAQPYLDNFTADTAIWAMRKYRPNLLLLHLLDADDQKHHYGPDSPQARDALLRLDERLGLLLSAFQETFPAEEAAIIVFSDHACQSVHTTVNLNDYLSECGLEPHQAFAHNAGGTAFIKLLRPDIFAEVNRAVSCLTAKPFVRRLLDPEEMRSSGLDTEFACGLEAADGFSFGWSEGYKGQHGYSLKREGYHCFYAAAGPGILPDKIIKGGAIVDICPLAAQLLGLSPWEMDGVNKVTEE